MESATNKYCVLRVLALLLFELVFHECLTVNTSIGSTVILPCVSPSDYPAWSGPYSNGTVVPYNYHGYPSFINPVVGEKNNRLSWNNKTNLVIGSVTRADNGNYGCTIPGASPQNVYLTVRVPPIAVEIRNVNFTSSNKQIIEGSEGVGLDLVCVSSGGYPEQTVQWYRGSVETKPLMSTQYKEVNDTSTNTLNITQVAHIIPSVNDDNVTYICLSAFLNEPRLPVSADATLYLNLEPEIPTLTSINISKEGDNKSVARCQTSGFRPQTSFNLSWIYRGTVTYYTGLPILDSINEKYSVSADFQRLLTKADNGETLICSVSHQTLSSPRTAKLNLTVTFQPENVTISGNQMIVANGTNPLRLTCITSSASPSPVVRWRNGTVELANNVLYVFSPGDYNGVVISQTLTLYPTRYMDGTVVSCDGLNTVSTYVVSTSVTLDLNYQPIIDSLTPQKVVEGNYSMLVCSASSKPPSTFRWYKEGVSAVLSKGNGTTMNNRLIYNIKTVTRADAGTYRCVADNGVEHTDSKSMVLGVQYPPDVVVQGSNTSVIANSTQLTCKASGVPNTGYAYGEWRQEWPGYGVVSRRPGSQTLILGPLTYEHSGIYTCSASNGVKIFGTEQEYRESSLYLQVKSFPVISYHYNRNVDTVKVPGKLNSLASVPVEYFSNAGAENLKCYRVINNIRQTADGCSTSNKKALILLKVFSHTVPADGILVNVSIHIVSEEDFGVYELEVTNEIGWSKLNFEIVAQGPPEAPYDIEINDIQQTSVSFSWSPGFHGGFDQTFVVQISSDKMTWINMTAIFQGKDLSRTTTTLVDLEAFKTYFLRIFAYNIEGHSNFTPTLNFTTLRKDFTETTFPSAVVGGVCGGIAVCVVVVVTVAFLLKRRGHFENVFRGKRVQHPTADSSPQYETLERRSQSNEAQVYSSLSTVPRQEASEGTYYNTAADKIYLNLQITRS